jgi:hypothetical protein
MTHDKVIHQTPPAGIAGISRRQFAAPLLALLTATIVLGTNAQETKPITHSGATNLMPGDILCTDSGDAIQGGFVLKVDQGTGQETAISHGGYLSLPFGIVVGPDHRIIVSEFARSLVQIDPNTGEQTLLADSTTVGSVIGIALDPKHDHELLIANYQDVLSLNLLTGHKRVVFHGGNSLHPLYVAADAKGDIFTLAVGWPNGSLAWQLVQLDADSASSRVVSTGGNFENPQGLAVLEGAIYVTDVATPDRNFGNGCVIRVDAATGEQTFMSEGGYLVAPVGIAVDATGQLIVADPYTINPESPDISDGGYDGAIIRINPSTGEQALIARGQGSTVNPCGVAVVPFSKP